MADWTLDELQSWDTRIREQVDALGLECFPQEFEICDHEQMLGYMAYSGMPSHYGHWSFGKSFEKLKTMYDYGVSGLPYEMVINSNPSLAYLMRGNSLLLQILTIAHVYGHNDFFRNNATFSHTRPELVLGKFKSQGARVRGYIEDPSIGLDKVEAVLDAAHALAFQCRRNLSVAHLPFEEERARQEKFRDEDEEPRPYKNPPIPQEDVLLFIRDHHSFLEDWAKDLLTIVHNRTQYFLPQIETKIMNEGWASFWHHQILNRLELPDKLHLEFLVRHNQVLRPTPGDLNPYHLGFKVFEGLIRREADLDETDEIDAAAVEIASPKLFEVREAERDVSFLRRFLTPELMRELDLFEHQAENGDRVISEVSDEEGWQQVKRSLIASIGTGSMPVIKIEDADYGHTGALLLKHYHDGRDLHLSYAEKTLEHLHSLWGREVVLEAIIEGKSRELSFDEEGFAVD